MQCKYRLWVIGIFVFVAQYSLRIIFRKYALHKTSLECPDVIFLDILTLYVKLKQALCGDTLQWEKGLSCVRMFRYAQTKKNVVLDVKTLV